MLAIFRPSFRNTAKVSPAVDEGDPYLRLRLLKALPGSIRAYWVAYEKTKKYHRIQFNKALSLLESLAYQEIDAVKTGAVAEFLESCQACPTLLMMDAPTDETTFPMTLMESFLDQEHLFVTRGERAFYLDVFYQLLELMPAELAGISSFNYQDEFGCNLLMHVIKHRKLDLLEAYLSHPQTIKHMNYDFVDSHTHFNVFCLVYAFRDADAFLEKLHAHKVRFSLDHLCAVLRQTDPRPNYQKAFYDFCTRNIKEERKLTPSQYEALQKALEPHVFVRADASLKGLAQALDPLPPGVSTDKVSVVTGATPSTKVFYTGTRPDSGTLASSTSMEEEQITPPGGVPKAK